MEVSAKGTVNSAEMPLISHGSHHFQRAQSSLCAAQSALPGASEEQLFWAAPLLR